VSRPWKLPFNRGFLKSEAVTSESIATPFSTMSNVLILFSFILYFFHRPIFMGGCQCPVDLAVQLGRVCSAMPIVLFDLNKMYVCRYFSQTS